jgi:hypothetical protein
MDTDSTKGQAGHALACLNALRGTDPAKALPNLRMIREFFGMIRPDDPMERSEAWWELCQLCRALSGNPQDLAEPRWESTIGATEKWCTKLN